MHLAYSTADNALTCTSEIAFNSTANVKTTPRTFSPNWKTMYFVTLGQFQLHNLKNSDEDLVNNAQLLRLRGKINSTPMKTWNEVLDKDMFVLESWH